MIPKIWSMADRIFSHFGPNSSENQNCEKLKKTPGEIIILHKCTIKDNHMIYGSWDMTCNRQNFFVTRGHFLPFSPPNSLENPNTKKTTKKPGDIIILHKCGKIHDHRIYCSWGNACDNFHFGLYFSLLPSNSPKNEKFKTIKKTPGDIII